MCACVRVRVCVRACVCACGCVRACVRLRETSYACVCEHKQNKASIVNALPSHSSPVARVYVSCMVEEDVGACMKRSITNEDACPINLDVRSVLTLLQ